MANKLYKIIAGVAYDLMLNTKQHIVSGAATAFAEGTEKIIGTTSYPITRFDSLPFFMSQSGVNMTALIGMPPGVLNPSTLNVVFMGSSTMFGHGLIIAQQFPTKLKTGLQVYAPNATYTNIAVEGIEFASMQTTANGGTVGQNLTTAFTYNPWLIVADEPTNWAAVRTASAQILQYEMAVASCWARGVNIVFNGSRPRGSLTTAQQSQLKLFNQLVAVHPVLKYLVNFDGDKYWDTATTYALRTIYDQGDATHLTDAGTTLLANDLLAIVPKVFRTVTAYSAIEVHRSTDNITYSLFDSITSFSSFTKSYNHLSGYYKVRGKLRDGSYTTFSTVTQVTNSAPTANAGSTQTITLPTSTVTLSGSGSDTDGTISSYLWSKVSGPSFGTITNPTSPSTTITGLTGAGTYVYRLTVTDNEGATGFNDVSITVNAAGNVSPTANAGADQTLAAGATTGTLSGSGTDSDGTIAGYAWSQISGPNTAGITSPSSASTGLTGLIAGVYVFRLTVTDNLGATGTDDVQITAVAAVGQRVLIDLGGDGIVDSGQTDGGIMTPSNAGAPGAIPGQAGDGKWWNNIVSCVAGSGADYPGTAYPITINRSGIVDIANTAVAMTIRLDKAPRGTFSAIDYSMNYGGSTVAVSDYPISAVMDNLYFHTSSGITTMTFVIPAGKTASIKFWGNRNSTGPRILQIRKAGDTTWLEYDATTNTTYATAVTLTGVTGTQGIEMQVKSGSTFGHVSVIDITLT